MKWFSKSVLKTHTPGGRLENRDWFENDGEQDTLVVSLYNISESFQPSVSTLKRIIRGKLSALLSRMYVTRQNRYEDHVHGLSLNVFSSPVQIVCEKGIPNFNQNWHLFDSPPPSFVFNNINNSFLIQSFLLLFSRLIQPFNTHKDFLCWNNLTKYWAI